MQCTLDTKVDAKDFIKLNNQLVENEDLNSAPREAVVYTMTLRKLKKKWETPEKSGRCYDSKKTFEIQGDMEDFELTANKIAGPK